MENINDDEKKDIVKKQVEKIESSIKENEKELDQIRKDCRHPLESINVKNIAGGGGVAEYRKVCGVCGQAVGYPTPDEVRQEVEGKTN